MTVLDWQTSKRVIPCGGKTLVMAIINVTPDSFSDGATFATRDDVLERVTQLISEGADILDVGAESTRPGSSRISIDEETERIVPAIELVAKNFDIPISVDTTKSEVAIAAVAAGAEIINDISGL